MRLQKTVISILFLITVLTFHFHLLPQDDEVTTIESVRVVNVEVPVRVFLKGSPVAGLNKNNFKIFENRKQHKINGFYIKKKKLEETKVISDLIKSRPAMKSRYFVLVFKIFEYNEKLHKGLKYLFKNVFQKSDQCLVFINNRSIFFKDLTHTEHVQAVLNKVLREESLGARQNMQKYLTKLEEELKEFYLLQTIASEGSFGETSTIVLRFLRRYLWVWREYKKKYLKPDIDSYYYFSRHLEKIKKGKWVINFYQIDKFPTLKANGKLMEMITEMIGSLQSHGEGEQTTMAKALSHKIRELQLDLHSTKNFSADEISKLFIKVDATFHTVLIPVMKNYLSEDLEYREVSSELETSLREITKQTGGSLQRTGNLETALEDIRKMEEITYMLTYSPEDPDKIGKIRVEVDNKKYKVLYDNQMRADYIKEYLKKKKLEIPDIRILNTEFKNKILSIDVKDFLITKQEELPPYGKIFVEIEILDSENKILYDKKKTIAAKTDKVSISIDFPWMQKGRYNLIIQVTDIQTGKTSSDFLQPVIR